MTSMTKAHSRKGQPHVRTPTASQCSLGELCLGFWWPFCSALWQCTSSPPQSHAHKLGRSGCQAIKPGGSRWCPVKHGRTTCQAATWLARHLTAAAKLARRRLLQRGTQRPRTSQSPTWHHPRYHLCFHHRRKTYGWIGWSGGGGEVDIDGSPPSSDRRCRADSSSGGMSGPTFNPARPTFNPARSDSDSSVSLARSLPSMALWQYPWFRAAFAPRGYEPEE